MSIHLHNTKLRSRKHVRCSRLGITFSALSLVLLLYNSRQLICHKPCLNITISPKESRAQNRASGPVWPVSSGEPVNAAPVAAARGAAVDFAEHLCF